MTASTSNIEFQLEAAFVTVLTAAANMTGCTIRRWSDASGAIAYPICLVHCNGSGEPEFSLNQGYDEAFVEIQIRTYKEDDKSTAIANGYLAAARDVFRSAGLAAALKVAQSTLEVYSVTQEGKTATIDDDKLHIRTLTLKIYATTVHLPEED